MMASTTVRLCSLRIVGGRALSTGRPLLGVPLPKIDKKLESGDKPGTIEADATMGVNWKHQQQKIVDKSTESPPPSSISKLDLLTEPPSPEQILFGKMKAKARGFQTTFKPISLGEWERTWERWRNDHRDWKDKLEKKRPVIFRPTPLQRKMLVWTGVYDSVEQVPAHVSRHTVRKAVMRRVRFALGSLFACAFLIWMSFSEWAPP